jgi:uncharacterized cupredoxin-like copper-binding protein
MYRLPAFLAILILAALAFACESSGAGGREINVTQGDDGCTPAVIEATPGEKLDLQVKNETDSTYEIEGIEGTSLEEVLVPEGRTRSVGYNVPDEGGVSKVKCYVPGGISTIMEIRAGEGGTAGASIDDAGEPTDAVDADAKVTVGLMEYEVTPDVESVSAGTILFEATNDSTTMVHELAVLRVEDDGSLENEGEIEDIAVGEGGTVTIDLEPGNYQLACLLVPGEAGSTTDHYQEGMWTEFEVTE